MISQISVTQPHNYIIMDDNLVTYLKLNVLLYSDDTVLLAESPKKIKQL